MSVEALEEVEEVEVRGADMVMVCDWLCRLIVWGVVIG